MPLSLSFHLFGTGIFNLELSWRDLNGSLHNKLNWVQIMADRGNITLSIADSTLATRVHNPTTDEADLEQGGGIEPSLLMQRDAYFHMDVFRMDQVIRNILTNAVSYCSTIVAFQWLAVYDTLTKFVVKV